MRILIVEDHVSLCAGLERYLSSIGFAVSTAHSVQSALDRAGQRLFDLLIIDLNLPDGTGWNLLKQLTAKSPVRAIAMSGWGAASDIAQSKGAGFMRHLIKPVTPEELTEAIEQVMRSAPAQPAEAISKSYPTRSASSSSLPPRSD